MMRSGFTLTSFGAVLGAALFSSAVLAQVPQDALRAEIVLLGERHDNPAHHARQAEWVAALHPKALVFEMLTPDQAARGNGAPRSDATTLEAALGWADSGWPAFEMYFPIFAAAPEAQIYGAGVPRDVLRAQVQRPLAQHPLAGAYGLDRAPDPQEQAAREAMQAAAHCDALPEEMLPVMVDAQRLRDMTLADAALRALRDTGGPVAVITGNGHARADWGVPALLAHAGSGVAVFALGQSEAGQGVSGTFSLTLDAARPDRDDPCAAFAD